MTPIVVSITDASKALSLGRSKIYELIHSGDLAIIKIGRRTLVSMKSIEALASKQGGLS